MKSLSYITHKNRYRSRSIDQILFPTHIPVLSELMGYFPFNTTMVLISLV